MRFITLVIIAALIACASCATLINNLRTVQAVNSDPNSTWKARPYKQFEGKTFDEVKRHLGTVIPIDETVGHRAVLKKSSITIPKEFDARKQWPSCVSVNEVRNQANCGSCWAFSGAEVLGDRFCIATNGTFNQDLSPEYIVECDSTDYGCTGGYLNNLWRFLSTIGTVTDTCDSYVSGGGDVPGCPSACDDGSPLKFYKADPKSVTLFSKDNLDAVQEDILKVSNI
jgi:cathepsin B